MIWARKGVDKMRGAILEMEAGLADAPAPAEAEAPAPAPGVPRIAEVGPGRCVLAFAGLLAASARASRDTGGGGADSRGRARFVRALVSPTTVLSSRWHPSRIDPEPYLRAAWRATKRSARFRHPAASCPSFVDKQLTRRRGKQALLAEAALKPAGRCPPRNRCTDQA